ncbi:HAD family hydrolase [Anaeromicropila populeti]|uniref:Haloacid dehalogenase superfamily, subfamily IA, variant 3 with third motif having DD or ED n=1 Tax=Anaeromicropila populeti TaxID=37658 RepID=A0A1I6JMI3_9FIRM|nr:HAD family phosphatase [Anaeromicropila populeti]SFR80188.1 haloacid dehalogenase superfamily, subfamily IA, variant 3 with third motif having DD or ED [Anaeromicropila populeti]
MLQGIIFDIDGVIVDSEPLHMKALIETLKRELDVESDIDENELIGLSLDDTIDKFNIPKVKEEVIKRLTIEYYLENVSADLIRPDIKQLWLSLIEKNIKFGCVSSAEMSICKKNISLLNLNDKIQVPIVAFESVEKTKPHPMPYLKMLEILGLNPDQVIVLEDSDTGIRSASLAGIHNIYAWPHQLSYSQNYEQAKMVIQNLKEIDFFVKILEERNNYVSKYDLVQ